MTDPAPVPNDAAPASASRSRLRALLPWLGTLLLMGYLVWAYDARAAWDALREAPLIGLVLLWGGVSAIVFFLDSAGLFVLFSRLNGAVQYRDVMVIKGSSYFLNIVNYAAASGGIAYLVWRRWRFPFLEVTSSVLFLNVVDLLVLNVFVTGGLWLTDLSLPVAAVQTIVYVNIGLYALYFGSMIYWNAGFDFLVLGRLRKWSIFSAFARAEVRTHLALFGLRATMLVVYICMQYAALQLFEIDAPLGEVMVYNSIVTLVITLPISIAGLGTSQLIMLEVYADYGTDAAILAYSTASIFAFMIIRAAIGYVSLAPLQRLPRAPAT